MTNDQRSPGPVEPVRWIGGTTGQVELIDQTLLPGTCETVAINDPETMWEAIRRLQVRGAPAIGIAAAYAVVLALRQVDDTATPDQARQQVRQAAAYLATSRPTAVNLFWALDRMERTAQQSQATSAGDLKDRLLAEAQAIHTEDAAMCRAIGRHGAGLIRPGTGVLTHCNAGGLATAQYGTALAVMFTAHEQGADFRVYADETRPLLQGARLTTWELMQAGIPTTLICDDMAGHVMQTGRVHLVITGADRIAANGDAANKIGTYTLAVLAKAHDIPFYIAAPSSTFDLSLDHGRRIPIEQRDGNEVRYCGARAIAPLDVDVYNPAFDVTPAELITGIITQHGIIEAPTRQRIAAHLQPA